MLVELSVMEQRYQAVLEVVVAGVPVAEVAERLRSVTQLGAHLGEPLSGRRHRRAGR